MKLEERIVEEIGRVPTSYAQVAYDQFWVSALTLNNYTGTQQQDDIGSLSEAFIDTANSYVGVTGSTKLNDAGDRKEAPYDFWAVRPISKDSGNENSFEWTTVASYPVGTDN
jgi:ABC-type branched-subunit amino acid transport system substrate-binding protein